MFRLEAFVLALSQHHRLLREIIGNNKGVLTLPSKEDAITSDQITDIIAHIGGEGLANYCRLKFREGYLTGNYKVYDIKAILTELREISKEGKFKENLKNKFNYLLDLAYRLSNPITYKAAKIKLHKSNDTNQLELFPEDTKQETPEKVEKPKKPKKKRRKRSVRLDHLADDIIHSEYGITEDSEDDSYSDSDYYDRPSISDSEYAYFAGEEVD